MALSQTKISQTNLSSLSSAQRQALAVANADNLFSYWAAMGIAFSANNGLSINTAWPKRGWLPAELTLQDKQAQIETIKAIPQGYVYPVFDVNDQQQDQLVTQLKQQGFEQSFEQIAMILDMQDAAIAEDFTFDHLTVNTAALVARWTAIASESFGYPIDSDSIDQLIQDPRAQVWIYQLGNKDAGSAVLFEEAGVLGVHMVGVSGRFRRRGLAKKIMQEAIEYARQQQIDFVSLQASAMGAPLYSSLGFQSQFQIINLKKQ